MSKDKYKKALNDIANDASKLHTLCRLIIDPTEASEKDIQTMIYIIKDYVEVIKETADKIIG